MEPGEFLRRHPPFDRLAPGEMQRLEQDLEVVLLPRGEAALRRGGPRADHLWIVRKGSVRLEREGRLVQVLEEGDPFGFPSLIGRTSPHVDAIAAEETLAYRLPAATFERLMQLPAFSEFFLLDLSDRLRRAAAIAPPAVGADLARPARSLVTRVPVRIGAGATVGEAARRMRDEGVSSVIVDGDPAGILTDRDLRTRVLAAGLGPDAVVDGVATRPLITLDAGASMFEVLLLMIERRVHHVPLVEGGRVTGVLTDTDLLRAQVVSPLALLERISAPDGAQDLGHYADALADIVESLEAAGLEAVQVARVVSRLNDALVAALLRAAEAALGPPPGPYAWIVFGSEGRSEQALLTDQDNALLFADGAGAEYFERLAQRVVDGLLAARFPPCPGGFMATRWRHPLAHWLQLFRGWIATPTPQALLEASSLFDYRHVHGSLDLAPLDAVVRGAARETRFLAHLAKSALGFEPPLGAFRQIRAEHGGVDLKRGGLLPIVGLARVAALEAGADARGTLERLAAAAAAGTLAPDAAATLSEAFRFLMRLRLRDQLRARREGRADGTARLEDLTALERAHLKEVFLAVCESQAALRLRYAVDRLG